MGVWDRRRTANRRGKCDRVGSREVRREDSSGSKAFFGIGTWRAALLRLPMETCPLIRAEQGDRHICCHDRRIQHVLVHSRERQLTSPIFHFFAYPRRRAPTLP